MGEIAGTSRWTERQADRQTASHSFGFQLIGRNNKVPGSVKACFDYLLTRAEKQKQHTHTQLDAVKMRLLFCRTVSQQLALIISIILCPRYVSGKPA